MAGQVRTLLFALPPTSLPPTVLLCSLRPCLLGISEVTSAQGFTSSTTSQILRSICILKFCFGSEFILPVMEAGRHDSNVESVTFHCWFGLCLCVFLWECGHHFGLLRLLVIYLCWLWAVY
jgi:hypothetical protein